MCQEDMLHVSAHMPGCKALPHHGCCSRRLASTPALSAVLWEAAAAVAAVLSAAEAPGAGAGARAAALVKYWLRLVLLAQDSLK